MAEIHEFPSTRTQREAEQRLVEAMRNVNDRFEPPQNAGSKSRLCPCRPTRPTAPIRFRW